LRAALGFIRKLTLAPDEVGPDDVRDVLEAGVGEQALIDAVTVCFHFNWIDRIADSLGFEVQSEDEFMADAKLLLKFGYGLPAPLRLLARNPRW
jgi:hypothetical protein